MQIIDLFSGIGGFSLAGKWAGWKTIQFCEINKFCQRVLSYHFPGIPIYNDIKTLSLTELLTNPLYDQNEKTIVTGGFPCQPYSLAGERKGTEDDRHLWPEMLRVIRLFRPDWVVAENVYGIVNWNGGLVFEQVQTDLEKEGYEVFSFLLPACAVNAPHRRDRIWFVAHTTSNAESRQNRESSTFERTGTSVNDKIRRGQQQTIQHEGLDDISWTTSDTINSGNRTFRDGVNKDRKKESEERDTSQSESDRYNEVADTGVVTNPGSQRQPQLKGVNRREEQEQDNRSSLRDKIESGSKGETFTNSERSSKSGKLLKKQGKRESGRCDSTEIDPDPNSKGLERSKINRIIGGSRKRRIQQFAGFLFPGWEEFPTEPPLCRRNDGLSERLDFNAVWRGVRPRNPKEYPKNYITFSKWRNESIKAYGNAIVPQVVYQIFKVINQIENDTQ